MMSWRPGALSECAPSPVPFQPGGVAFQPAGYLFVTPQPMDGDPPPDAAAAMRGAGGAFFALR